MQPTFFQKYQTFFSIIIAGALIAGGIIISKTMPTNSPTTQTVETEASVKKEMLKAAKDVGVDTKKLEVCLDENRYETKISDAITLADRSGMSGTPTFFIIKRTFGPNDAIASEKQWAIVGARDKETFLKSITEEKSPADQYEVTGEPIMITAEDHYLGPMRAEIIIVEYSDIDCPFCKAAEPIIDEILREHPEYAFVYRHAPILSRHPFAGYRAEATECVKEIAGTEKFWKFLDIIAK